MALSLQVLEKKAVNFKITVEAIAEEDSQVKKREGDL